MNRFDEPEFIHLIQAVLIGDAPIISEATWLSEQEVQASNELKRALGKVFALRIGPISGIVPFEVGHLRGTERTELFVERA